MPASYNIRNVFQSNNSAQCVVSFFEMYIHLDVVGARSEGRMHRGFISVASWHPGCSAHLLSKKHNY